MTQAADSPWEPFTPAELEEMARRSAVLLRHDNHVPARSAAERAEYDQIDLAAAHAAEAAERDYHFYGAHVQDPCVPHEDCFYSCPYDTPEQARARWRLAERADATRTDQRQADQDSTARQPELEAEP
jgi:hypothetical protein